MQAQIRPPAIHELERCGHSHQFAEIRRPGWPWTKRRLARSSLVELPLDVAVAGSGADGVAGRAAESCACQLLRANFHICRRIALAIGFSDSAG